MPSAIAEGLLSFFSSLGWEAVLPIIGGLVTSILFHWVWSTFLDPKRHQQPRRFPVNPYFHTARSKVVIVGILHQNGIVPQEFTDGIMFPEGVEKPAYILSINRDWVARKVREIMQLEVVLIDVDWWMQETDRVMEALMTACRDNGLIREYQGQEDVFFVSLEAETLVRDFEYDKIVQMPPVIEYVVPASESQIIATNEQIAALRAAMTRTEKAIKGVHDLLDQGLEDAMEDLGKIRGILNRKEERFNGGGTRESTPTKKRH